MNNLESNVFGKKKFSDLLKEIYDNQKKKEHTAGHFLQRSLY